MTIKKYWFFWIPFGIAFLAIAYKLLNIPITHDESRTILFYCKFSVWEIMMFPDNIPNNHILNTLLTKASISVFGVEDWAARLPSILSFLIYTFGAYRITRFVLRDNINYVIAAAAIFLGNAYFLDFFGLCRGYAMAAALATLSVSYVLTGYHSLKNGDILIGLCLAVVASYANFTLIVFLACVAGLSFLYFLLISESGRTYKFKVITGIVGILIAYGALISTPILKMTSTDQFHFWSSNGFFKDTILTLTDHWVYNAHIPLGIRGMQVAYFAVIVICISVVLIIRKLWKTKDLKYVLQDPLTLSCILLCGTAIISILQSWILKTPNLSGRTAIFFYPLFGILFLTMLAEWKEHRGKLLHDIIAWSIPFLLFWHIINTYNSRDAREWWYDQNTHEVLSFLKDKRTNSDQQISLKTNWYFHPSFYFYADTGKAPWLHLHDYDKQIDSLTSAQYYYVLDSDLPLLEGQFEKVKQYGWDRWLLKRK